MSNASLKTRAKSLLLTSIITMLLLSTTSTWIVQPIYSSAEIRIYVNSPEYHAEKLNEVFTIDVAIENVDSNSRLIGAEFKLQYNTTLLEVLDVTEGSFMKQAGDTYLIEYVEFDYVIVGILLIPQEVNEWLAFPEGNGTLATITVRAAYQTIEPEPPASCDLKLYGTMLIDDDVEEIPHFVSHGKYDIRVMPRPKLTVRPDYYTATHRGEVFEIDVDIKDVDPDWRLIGAEFKLQYNTTLLEVLDVTEGSFMKQAGDTYLIEYVEFDYVIVGILLIPQEVNEWLAFPEGNGTLATIAFNVTHGPPASCDLKLYGTMLIDDDVEEIPHFVSHGKYEIAIETLSQKVYWGERIFQIVTVSNSTVSPIAFDQPQKMISFNVTGPDDATGFCDITIPRELLNGYYTIRIDGVPTPYTQRLSTEYASLYFTYQHSTHQVEIFGTRAIPELPEEITPIDIEVDVGAMHFRGEIAEFYALTTYMGERVNASSISALLYKPDGSVEALDAERIATGLYKMTYTIPGDASTGTYALLVEASYTATIGVTTVESYGASLRCFLLSPTLTNMDATIENVEGEIATIIIPNLGAIRFNLTAISAKLVDINGTIATVGSDVGEIKLNVDNINARLVSLDGTIATINSTLGSVKMSVDAIHLKVVGIDWETRIATIQTDLGTIKGYVKDIDDGGLATINTEIGLVKQDISDIEGTQESIKGNQESFTIPQYATLVLALIAAVAAILSVIFVRRKPTH